MSNLSYYLGMGCSVHVEVYEFLAEAHVSCSDGDMRIDLGKITTDDIKRLEEQGIEVYIGD